jgi:chromosome partitioning protein
MVEATGKPLVFVINAANPRARITGEAAVVLSQHGTVAPVTIHQRTDFAASMIDGRTVMELPRSERSSDEINRLWDYLQSRFHRTVNTTHLPDSFAGLGGRATPAPSVSADSTPRTDMR